MGVGHRRVARQHQVDGPVHEAVVDGPAEAETANQIGPTICMISSSASVPAGSSPRAMPRSTTRRTAVSRVRQNRAPHVVELGVVSRCQRGRQAAGGREVPICRPSTPRSSSAASAAVRTRTGLRPELSPEQYDVLWWKLPSPVGPPMPRTSGSRSGPEPTR
jgi:hypothetical protein